MGKLKDLVEREVEDLNRGDLDGVCSRYTRDVVFEDCSDPLHPAVGMAEFRASMKAFFAGFSDLNVDIRRFLASEDGTGLAIEYVLTGTQDGPFAGIAPTNRKISAWACSVYDLKGDLIGRERIYWDMAFLLGQLRQA